MKPWIITLLTVLTVYYLDRWENKKIQSLFDWVPAILLAYLIPALISILLKEDFSQADIHQYSKQYFIPLAIIAVMSSLSLVQLKQIGWKPIALFLAGSFWIAIFPIILVVLLAESEFISQVVVGQNYWKGIPPIVGSWIGGSTSQLVLKEIVDCPEDIFLTILIMDNILVNIWTILMFQFIKRSDVLNRRLSISKPAMPAASVHTQQKTYGVLMTSVLLVAGVLSTNLMVDHFVAKIIILSVLGLAFSNLLKSWNFAFVLKLGSILIILVMAVLGLKLKFDFLQFEYGLLGFLVVWLVSHFIVMLIVSKLLNVSMAWVPIASMANVGGIATAPAVTAAYDVKLMPHAIVLAILSMATGTFWGMLTIYFLQGLL